MAQWEYCKVDLGAVPLNANDVDVLNDLGKEGWELVNITRNSIAYLKRQLAPPPAPESVRRRKSVAPETQV